MAPLNLEPSSGVCWCFRIIVPVDRGLAPTVSWWAQCDLVESFAAMLGIPSIIRSLLSHRTLGS